MEKTRLGLSVGVVGAAAYFLALFGGLLPALILAGYVLMFETNGWLKRTAVKALVISILFSVVLYLINLIPECCGIVNDIAFMCDDFFDMAKFLRFMTVLEKLIVIFQYILMLALGFKAMKQRTIVIGFIDSLVNKCMQ